MNTFCEHHNNSIKFDYRCFDRILLNGLIQPFQQPERVIGFFNAYREGKRVTRNCLGDIAWQFQNWVKNRCQKWGTTGGPGELLHPNRVGYQAMAETIALKLLAPSLGE